MFNLKKISFGAILTVGALFACQTEEMPLQNEVSEDVLSKISNLGFSTQNVVTTDGGYLVEGDIMLYDNDLQGYSDPKFLRIAEVEQYRTTNLVSAPRTIKISIASKLPTSYIAALDEAIARYNAENLTITFSRVASGADISIVSGNGSYLASAGFPTSTGAPHNQIKVNSRAIGNQPQSTVATILAHEIGHCIGFRHTDYMDRSYSCGGSPTNEGASTVGAIYIPGTATGPEAGSWMLACIGSGQNRTFTNNDKTALSYLY
jgi:Dual-action HEIGH metallo-peptidase